MECTDVAALTLLRDKQDHVSLQFYLLEVMVINLFEILHVFLVGLGN